MTSCHSVRHRAPRGFSLVELLIALTICALIAAGVAVIVPPARAAFELTPAEIELQQRARLAVDVITQAVRGAGADAAASEEFGRLSSVVPAVILSADADGRLTRLKVITHRAGAAQAVLERHQAGPGGALSLAADRCPAASVVCGFMRDATALISDGSGRFDLFTVASVDGAAGRITSRRSLSAPYAAGSFVLEVEVDTYQLDPQPDGSHTLVRVTSGGAVQPLVDRVDALSFQPHAIDAGGALTPLPIAMLTDGPWFRADPDGSYDEDLFRVKRVDIALTLHAAAPSTAARTVRFAVSLRNVP